MLKKLLPLRSPSYQVQKTFLQQALPSPLFLEWIEQMEEGKMRKIFRVIYKKDQQLRNQLLADDSLQPVIREKASQMSFLALCEVMKVDVIGMLEEKFARSTHHGNKSFLLTAFVALQVYVLMENPLGLDSNYPVQRGTPFIIRWGLFIMSHFIHIMLWVMLIFSLALLIHCLLQLASSKVNH